MGARIVLSKDDPRAVDVMMLVLLRTDEYSLLPDLYDIFGEAAMLKFLDIFAGCTFTVPSQAKLAQVARDVDIYIECSAARNKDNTTVQRNLAERYNLATNRVAEIHVEMKELVEQRLSIGAIFKKLETTVGDGQSKKG